MSQEALIRAGTILVVAIFAAWLAGQVIRQITRRIVQGRPGMSEEARLRAETRSTTVGNVLSAIARTAIGGMATLLFLGEFGFDIAPLIAGAGIIGLAIGFGAQGLVSDVVSGLFMLVEDQYGVGDWVDLGEAKGLVERVGLRTTQVRSIDGLLWTVRNGEISRTANANQGWSRALIDVGVGYDADLAVAQRVIQDVGQEMAAEDDHRDRFVEPPEVWGVQDLGEDAVTIRLVAKTKPGEQFAIGRQLRLRVKEALDAEGVEMPFPQRTVWLRTDAQTGASPIPVAVGDANGHRADD